MAGYNLGTEAVPLAAVMTECMQKQNRSAEPSDVAAAKTYCAVGGRDETYNRGSPVGSGQADELATGCN